MLRGPKAKRGLKVGHTEGLVKVQQTGWNRQYSQQDGIYIYCWVHSKEEHLKGWRPICGLRFAREQDALCAAASLTKAGLDCYAKLRVADEMTVRAIACENLQW